MKKLFLKISGSIIGLIIILTIYLNSSFFIETQEWKYTEGTHIGDWLGKNEFEIKDGIIYTHTGNAKIVFCLGKNLIIENTKTQVRGYYANKN